jgi:hypothetical protein
MQESESIEQMHSGSGLWIKESFFNHSCAPNCEWTVVGEYMIVRAMKPIKSGEELCLTYTDIFAKSYAERREIFKDWIDRGVGFECKCPVCAAIRSNRKLRQVDEEANRAYTDASKIISFSNSFTPMGKVAEQVMPSEKRKKFLAFLSTFPLHIQHYSAVKLWVMQGSSLNEQGRRAEALEAFQKAADIGYAIRGYQGMARAKDLWRLVGSMMNNSQPDGALDLLQVIWESRLFTEYEPTSEARQAFVDLTIKYSLPWWVDRPNHHQQQYASLRSMAQQVCKGRHGKCKK